MVSEMYIMDPENKVWNLVVLKISGFERLFLLKKPVLPINGFQNNRFF